MSRGPAKEDWQAARRESLERMHADLAARVGSMDSLTEWQSWLKFTQSFHRYSFNNTVLIWMQRPDATAVAGYRAWLARGRQVRRGEKAIQVFAPVTQRAPRLDSAGNPVYGTDGKPVIETRMVGVKPASVFDVSQTEGAPLPEQPDVTPLTGEAPLGLWASLVGYCESKGYAVSRGDCGSANGLTRFDSHEVLVRPDINDAQAVKTLAHEAAHVTLHEKLEDRTCRGLIEVEAESVAFLVTAAHGLDSSQYTFNYVAGWAHQAKALDPEGPNVEEIVQATGQRVVTAADQILNATRPGPSVTEVAVGSLALEIEPKVERALRPVQAMASDRPASSQGALPGMDMLPPLYNPEHGPTIGR
ncbi:MAG: ArdC family protein [Actinobacteria bacterium]|nr:ArdC family protein [Actinomycetota bacterium]